MKETDFSSSAKHGFKLNLRDVLWKVRDEQWDIIFAGFWCFFCVCFPRGRWRTSLLELPFFLSTPFKSRHGHIMCSAFDRLDFLGGLHCCIIGLGLESFIIAFCVSNCNFFETNCSQFEGFEGYISLGNASNCLHSFWFWILLFLLVKQYYIYQVLFSQEGVILRTMHYYFVIFVKR